MQLNFLNFRIEMTEEQEGQTKKLKPNRLEYAGKMILAPMVKVGIVLFTV